MDSEVIPSSGNLVKCCNCGYRCSLVAASPGSWIRSVKRKYGEFEVDNQFFLPGIDNISVAKVQIENECVALRETVSSQQQSLQDLYAELEEERNASSSAANEAMSMILRLQREKAEIQMEARQFKRFVEEKMAHDQQELLALEDMLYKREQVIQSLTCEVQAYKHRMMSFGLSEAEAEGSPRALSQGMMDFDAQYELPTYEYPPLKCNLNENHVTVECVNDDTDIEKYAFGETPRDTLKNLESRINQMERSPSYSQLDGDLLGGKNILEKGKEVCPDFLTESPKLNTSIKKMDCVSQSEENANLKKLDNTSEVGDDMSDRVYTIDSVHNGAPYNSFTEPKAGIGIFEDYITTPRESFNHTNIGDPEIKKLYTRLQALEADRESMRQAIISMRTDKAQLVLLKEIAQHLCKEMSPESRIVVKKPSLGSFRFMSALKWIASFIFWRTRARRSKYIFGLSANSVGLLMLLEKGPRVRPWRCLTSTQV
ncbi:Myosin-binding protein 7 [Quillaja saponaria]|uniref:Myosin-binding protein 7 n=1 Tax=Quillaja saponaria TaxID=32244 RepID=A0AAD7VD86_QUISA|nr:Myosin-binding protein 7 [Quillaja saponaria]